MQLFYMILAVILFFMFSDHFKKIVDTNQVTIGTYKTKFFQKDSKTFFKMLEKESGYSEESLQEFAMMEDQFLEYEKQTVCHHIARLREAMTLDQQMRDRFQGWDFSYHQKHIKQMSEPSKLVNKDLSCA